MDWLELEDLPRETLVRLIKAYAHNWLTLDGLWFRSAEDEYGLEAALKLDAKVWQRQALAEARRVKEALNLTDEGPLAVVQAYNFMTGMHAFPTLIFEEKTPERVVLYWTDCWIQESRMGQGLGEFPCKEVSMIQFCSFAEVVDPRVKVRCLFCPPDPHPPDMWCKWELTL